MPSTISAGTTAGTAIAIAGDTTGNLAFQTNGTTTAMTVDTNQNVGIGTTSPDIFSSGQNRVVGIQSTTGSTSLNIGSTNGSRLQLGIGSTRTAILYSDSTNYTALSTETNLPLVFLTNQVERMRIATDGTISTTIGSTLYGAFSARAWVNFNGTGTVAIRTSRNVSSITDNGTGDYTVNLTTAMPDNEYAITASAKYPSSTNYHTVTIGDINGGSNPTTSSFRLMSMANTSNQDCDYVMAAIFR